MTIGDDQDLDAIEGAGKAEGLSRRRVLTRGALGAVAVWSAPTILRIDVAAAAGSAPPVEEVQRASLVVTASGPTSVFVGEVFDFTVQVLAGTVAVAEGVVLTDTLPAEGTFVSSAPAATPVGGLLTVPLGALPAGGTQTITVTWRAPLVPTTLTNAALAGASNADPVGDTHVVSVTPLALLPNPPLPLP